MEHAKALLEGLGIRGTIARPGDDLYTKAVRERNWNTRVVPQPQAIVSGKG